MRGNELWNLHNSMIEESCLLWSHGNRMVFPADTVLFPSTDNLLAGVEKSVLTLVPQLHSGLILLKSLRSHVLGEIWTGLL